MPQKVGTADDVISVIAALLRIFPEAVLLVKDLISEIESGGSDAPIEPKVEQDTQALANELSQPLQAHSTPSAGS